MGPKKKRTFESVIEPNTELLRDNTLFWKLIGNSEEKVKEKQVALLARLYKGQRLAVLTIFCTSRKAIIRLAETNENLRVETINIDEEVKIIARRSALDPTDVAQEFMMMTEEEAVQRLRIVLDDIHLNCAEVGQRLGIEFNEAKHGPLNV